MSASVRDIAAQLDAERNWRDGLICNARSGVARPLLANAIHALRTSPDWAGVLAYDEFSVCVRAVQPTPWGHRDQWTDEHDIRTAEWLQREGIWVSREVAGQAVETVARETKVHPVRTWLRTLEWDCRPRLETWLTTYLGVDSSPYASAVGGCTLIGAVARALRPGCKLDTMLVLEGPQGLGKSQACGILGGQWFTDEICEPGTKDASVQVAGAWLIEFSELDSLSRAETSSIKAFMSRAVDRFRPPYGRRAVEVPRGCWFVGSCNTSGYLRDETGGRRFWPVTCGVIELDSLRRDREQLFAEARVMYEAGAKWWLEDPVLIRDAKSEQLERYDRDPWHDGIAAWVDGREFVSIGDVLRSRGREEHLWTPGDKSRITRIMTSLGWTYTRRRYADGGRQYVFVPSAEVER